MVKKTHAQGTGTHLTAPNDFRPSVRSRPRSHTPRRQIDQSQLWVWNFFFFFSSLHVFYALWPLSHQLLLICILMVNMSSPSTLSWSFAISWLVFIDSSHIVCVCLLHNTSLFNSSFEKRKCWCWNHCAESKFIHKVHPWMFSYRTNACMFECPVRSHDLVVLLVWHFSLSTF